MLLRLNNINIINDFITIYILFNIYLGNVVLIETISLSHNISISVIATWRGHVESVTCLHLIEEKQTLLTSSLDCTVRMWTTAGHYIG